MSSYLPLNSESGIIKKTYTTLINNSLKISHRILFQCCAISNSFLAIGCNTGNIYVFITQNSKFKYWSNIISNDSPIIGMQFSPSKHYLAYHNKKYQIIIYKLNLVNEKNLMIRLIDGTQCSVIHSIIWDEECSKIFCGYYNGVVDVIYIPQNAKDYFHVPYEGLLKLDKQNIVQLDLMKNLLLISTTEKVILINTQTKYTTFIGTKPRLGQYGACFWYDNSKQLRIVSARPGYRLWIALVDGTVEETQQYKTWNDSLKYKINDADTDSNSSRSGQYTLLALVKNSNILVAIENDGPLFIIDLIKKSRLAVIDYGTSLTKIVCSTHRVIFNSSREVVTLAIAPFKEALVTILDEEIDSKYAIDLFIDVMNGLENGDKTEGQNDVRIISNTLSPELLSRLVQKSAEIGYRFCDTNKLQVRIQDNEDYQNIFCSIRSSEDSACKATINPVSDSLDDGSTESDCSSDPIKRNTRNTKRVDKRKGLTKTPQFLQTIYDKTSNFLVNIDVLSSSNSMNEPFYEHIVPEELDERGSNTLQEIAYDIPENMSTTINLMELEANGYIASEKYKQKDVDDDSKIDFINSLCNFCETWLLLNLDHWTRLSSFELYIQNCSATFPIFKSKLLISSESNDNFVEEQLKNAMFANSWSNTIGVKDWIKCLPVSDKIYQMTSNLLSQCFFYETFGKFPDLIQKMFDVTDENLNSLAIDGSVDSFDNEYYEEVLDKQTQIKHQMCWDTWDSTADVNSRYEDLLHVLTDEVWLQQSDTVWIGLIIKYFHKFLDMKSLRQWIRSGITHKTWSIVLNSFREVRSAMTIRDDNFKDMSHVDLEKNLFDSLCVDTIYSFVEIDKILSIMKQMDIINWRILVENENLDSRDVLHFSLKYELDLTDYVVHLFKYVNLSIKYPSRYSLLEHIYSQSDVVISFIYSLISNRSANQVIPRICDCGLLITYSESVLPDSINSLAIEILKWGSNQGVFKNDSKLFSIARKLCLNAGYHQGYIELLVGMSNVNELVKIGVQVASIDILKRLRDCYFMSLSSMIEMIDFLIDCRRRQSKQYTCLTCDTALDHDTTTKHLLSWNDIGGLIFTELTKHFNYLEIMHQILPKLSCQEMDQMKELLTDSIDTVLDSGKVVERNHMAKFINAEMSPDEACGDITEKYLNIYTMTKQELSGLNWGRIVTDNMVCDLCGMKLLVKSACSESREVIAFCCKHAFHRQCFVQFALNDDCFLC